MTGLSIIAFTLLIHLMVFKQHDPFEILVDYQNKQRQSAELFENQYNLLPFLVHKNKQTFVYQHQNDKQLTIQVIVYWFDSSNKIIFPSFNLSQKVRITIQQDVYSKIPIKPIMSKQFLTQSGFSIKVQNGKRYKWTIETLGNEKKMVQIAIGSKNIGQIKFRVQRKNHSNQIALLKSLKQNLEKTQANWMKKEKKEIDNNIEISSMWAWISSAEILSLFGFLALQLILFDKFSISFSVI